MDTGPYCSWQLTSPPKTRSGEHWKMQQMRTQFARTSWIRRHPTSWHLSGDIGPIVWWVTALWKPEDMLDSISSNGHLELIWNFGKFSYWCTGTGIHGLHAFIDIQNNVRHRPYECDKSELMKFQYVSIACCRPSVQRGEGKKVKKKLLIYAYTRYNEFNMAGHDNANIILNYSVMFFIVVYCIILYMRSTTFIS